MSLLGQACNSSTKELRQKNCHEFKLAWAVKWANGYAIMFPSTVFLGTNDLFSGWSVLKEMCSLSALRLYQAKGEVLKLL